MKFVGLALLQSCASAFAATISITSITTELPTGTQTTGTGTAANPYTDDLLISTITAGGVTFSRDLGQIVRGNNAFVRSFASSVNAEFGDDDDGSDGDPNPFVAAGLLNEGDLLTSQLRESTDPSIQNPSISAAVNSFSLSQGVDGEGSDYVLDILFELGVNDNAAGLDPVAEFLIFERGMNSDVRLQAIVGGTPENPTVLNTTFDILRGDFTGTGIHIDTIEIGSSQQLGAAAIDLDDLGVASGQQVFGLRITSLNGSGADIPALFALAQNPVTQTSPPLTPEPTTPVLFLLGTLFLARRRR